MNNLNSVLLEGSICEELKVAHLDDGTAMTELRIQSERTYKSPKREGGQVTEQCQFTVKAFSRLAEICAEYLTVGRGIRVVGRLSMATVKAGDTLTERVWITAEHVEFKPQRKPEDVPEAEAVEAASKADAALATERA